MFKLLLDELQDSINCIQRMSSGRITTWSYSHSLLCFCLNHSGRLGLWYLFLYKQESFCVYFQYIIKFTIPLLSQFIATNFPLPPSVFLFSSWQIFYLQLVQQFSTHKTIWYSVWKSTRKKKKYICENYLKAKLYHFHILAYK